MVNTNRRTLQKGEQAFYCYGHRSNKYLLVNYGFCFQDNGYDSFEFNLVPNPPLFKLGEIVFLSAPKKGRNLQQVRLKKDQINEMLLFYIRCHLGRPRNEPWDLYELRVLNWYLDVIEFLIASRKFTQEENREALK